MTTTLDIERPAAAATPQIDTWRLRLASGLVIHVPPTLKSLSTHVLLEQECWFEPEMSLLPHLVAGGVHALDIGANHGVVALELARASGRGRVWAFEPTALPRAALARSVLDNGFNGRIEVLPWGLADAPGTASFAVQANSELNSRQGRAERHETVELRTLDQWLDDRVAESGAAPAIGFVKLDAEGDEVRVLAGGARFFETQSPVVLFELKHGAAVNEALLDAWPVLGYELFRWSAELNLLRPFDRHTDELAFALNLVAVRPAQQAELAARGLLVRADDLAVARLPAEPQHALAAWAAAFFDTRLSAPQRLLSLLHARDAAHAAIDQPEAAGVEDWVLLISCLQALGAQAAAVALAQQVLARWHENTAVPALFATPLPNDLHRPRSTEPGPWLRQLLAEYAETRRSFSSYFEAPAPARWAALMQHPDHSAEVERRWLLAHAAADRPPPATQLAWLRRLPAPECTANPVLWQGLVESMRLLGRG